MEARRESTIEQAAAKAGFSTSSGNRIERENCVPSVKARKVRRGGRPNPLTDEIRQEIVDILESAPTVRAVAVYHEILLRHPELPPGVRRTIERIVARWRKQYGPEKEVIFHQTHEVGRRCLSDFTHVDGITIEGQDFPHLLYHFRMQYSGFEYANVVLGGESFVALSEGLQNALAMLGGVPMEHRSDSLSAAFRNMEADARQDVTKRYVELCEHYGMHATRNNRGVAHENGSIESPHGHLKAAIIDAVAMRGSSDFESVATYRAFIDVIISRHNERHAIKIEAERAILRPLPGVRKPDYELKTVSVTRSGGFVLKNVFYTVPSRLIGSKLRVRVYDDHLAIFCDGTHLFDLQRARSDVKRHVINYHHIVHSLRRKPMALYDLVYRDQVFPREAYRRTFHYLNEKLTPKETCKIMVGLLALAHDRACEAELAVELAADLDADRLPDLDRLQTLFAPDPASVPNVVVELCSLDVYECLLDNDCMGEPA